MVEMSFPKLVSYGGMKSSVTTTPKSESMLLLDEVAQNNVSKELLEKSLEDVDKDIAKLTHRRDSYKGMLKELLPIEANNAVILKEKIQDIDKQLHQLQLKKSIRHEYPVINLLPALKLHSGDRYSTNKYPKLAVFRYDRPICKITPEKWTSELSEGTLAFIALSAIGIFTANFMNLMTKGFSWLVPEITVLVAVCIITGVVLYKRFINQSKLVLPTLKMCQEVYDSYSSNYRELICKFSGFIPYMVQQNIKKAKTVFGKQIYLICEASESDWSVIKKDPLVCGWKDDTWYLIDKFDVKDFEEAIAEEFTDK